MSQAQFKKIERTTLMIYRDCLKLIYRVSETDIKRLNLIKHIRQEFIRNKHIANQEEIEDLRDNAIRGLSNYFLFHVKDNLVNIKVEDQ